ncbi:hypothetical protein PMNALOAF_2768 [Methylobacterium adhaesivum]|uniref:Phage tail assembly protein n=1 Tax=Methylobacterium adhaesivum TaxID=333297 RepID=A0ABT8BLQ1_9HYPH|nr:phage tail assembly protein [Methylobacterium adhaesivum]MDN3592121.1 phage tail assembly protein [Methylobacterium adhaesivum]GJD31509.1 hypothetical protein PMNALOAF_2768 [Methylobacterium adhaesivum]
MSKKNYDKRLEVEVPLEFPFETGGVEYAKLTMRRPKTRDSMDAAKVKGTDGDRGVFMLARLCNVSPDVIEELDEIDSNTLSEQLSAFTGRQSAN